MPAHALLLVLYNTAYTAVVVPYGALTPALTRAYDERTRLDAARMGWSMGGGILAGVGIPLLAKATGSFAVAAAVLALVALPPLLITVWTTRGRDPLPQPGARAQGFFSVLKVPAFRRTAALFVCAWTSIAVLSALVPFYVEHVVQAPCHLTRTRTLTSHPSTAHLPSSPPASLALQLPELPPSS